MPIQLEMIRDNRVVLQTYSQPLSQTEMGDLRNQMHSAILPASVEKLHIIADFRSIQNLPRWLLTVGTAMLRTSHPNTGYIVCVTPDSFIHSMANIFAKLSSRHQVKVVKSLDHAFSEIDALLSKSN